MNVLNSLAKLLLVMSESFKVENWILMLMHNDFVNLGAILTENTFIQKIYEGLIPIGIGLAFIYMLCDLIEIATYRELTLESIVRGIIQVCIIALFIQHGYSILSTFVNFGSVIADEFIKAVPVAELNAVDDADLDVVKSLINLLVALGRLLPNLGFVIVCSIPIKFVMLVRSAEIMVYTAIAPIALSDIHRNFTSSQAFKFLKEYMALCLQGLIIAAILFIGTKFNFSTAISTEGFNTSSFGMEGADLIYAFIIITLIFKSKKIAKDLLGA